MDAVTLQQMINLYGASWTAEENDISRARLRPGEMNLMGLAFTEEMRLQQLQFAESTELFEAAIGLPAFIDWRNNNGNYVTAVKNQASCGSCVSFATCAVLESRVRIGQQSPGLSIDLSEAHLFSCGCGNCCATGWLPNRALDFAKSYGVGLERDFPYQPGDQACKTIPPAVKVSGYSAASSTSARKQAISLRGPVSASMAVYEDFTYYSKGIYKHVTGSLVGYHQVCVVGYDDQSQCWIAKNSWGNWGESGFFRIAYGECGLDTQYPFYDPEVRLVGNLVA
ncbi:MAG: C1 family peptidase [Beijerinckiaceae bacterium]|jgi:C1A family cysteine protease|nr:C1 family peptidase [Beijerinckiaceae bacterium]